MVETVAEREERKKERYDAEGSNLCHVSNIEGDGGCGDHRHGIDKVEGFRPSKRHKATTSAKRATIYGFKNLAAIYSISQTQTSMTNSSMTSLEKHTSRSTSQASG